MAAGAGVTDQLARPLRDLRVSVTDRCNFRCRYCMPRELFGADHAFLPRAELLDFDEITRLVTVFARLGVVKIRLTGGEPLMRRDLATLVGKLAAVPGIEDIALTTNASLLAAQAADLKAAGLSRLTVSLDTLDPGQFRAIADVAMPLSVVLDGIEAARRAGFGPLKINTVLKRGVNEDALEGLVEYAREHGDVIRFIEYMDVGTTNGWRGDEVVPAAEVLARVSAVHPVVPVDAAYPGEVATRYRFADGRGELGLIGSVTRPFCRSCTRARLTAVGELFTCLFAAQGRDLRGLLRGGADEAELEAAIRGIWGARADRYSELRAQGDGAGPRAEMSYLGG
jgi:cyclic pyranopterin phosphate synthase